MKLRTLLVVGLLAAVGTVYAQNDFDDIYYNPRTTKTQTTKQNKKGVTKEKSNYVPDMSQVDIDAYNRRGENYYYTSIDTIGSNVSNGEDFVYTQQIQKYYNPTIVIDNQDLLIDILENSYGNVEVIYKGSTPILSPLYNLYFSPGWVYPTSWMFAWDRGPYWGGPYWSPTFGLSWDWSWGWGGLAWGSPWGWGPYWSRPTLYYPPAWGWERPNSHWMANHWRPQGNRPVNTRPGWTASNRPITTRPGNTRPGAVRPGTTAIASTRPGIAPATGVTNGNNHRPGVTTTSRNPNSSAVANSRPNVAASASTVNPATNGGHRPNSNVNRYDGNYQNRYPSASTRPGNTATSTTNNSYRYNSNSNTNRNTSTYNSNSNSNYHRSNNSSSSYRSSGNSFGGSSRSAGSSSRSGGGHRR